MTEHLLRDNYIKDSRLHPQRTAVLLYKELGCCVHTILGIMLKEEQEHKFAKFGSTYLKYRKIVIEWMIDVCDYFNLHPTTTHAAIAYLDRLQPNEKYSRFEWQMLAICCILISSKYNESESDVPDLATLEEITQQQISNDSVLNYELWALQRIGWTLSVRTSMAFLSSYVAVGVTFRSDRINGMTLESFGLEKTSLEKSLSNLASMCAVDESFKSIKSSLVASAILLYSRRQLKISPEWCPELVRITSYEASSLLVVVDKVHRCCSGESDKADKATLQSSVASCVTAAAKLSLQSPGGPDNYSTDEIASPGYGKASLSSSMDKENSSWDSPVSITGFPGIPSCL